MDERLRKELLRRVEEDQDATLKLMASAETCREDYAVLQIETETPWPWCILEWQPEEDAPRFVQIVLATTRRNTAWFRDVVAQFGWPGRSLVGEDGADAAWMLLTHTCTHVSTVGSEEDLQFRRDCIPLLREAVRLKEADPRHLAANVDSVREQDGELAEYGVLCTVSKDGVVRFDFPAHDPLVLNRNREDIGLPAFEHDVARKAKGQYLVPFGPGREEAGMAWPPKV